jgi:drug/metabolite transporter (DMT)-like permease
MALIWGSSFLFTELSLRMTTFFGVAFWRTVLGAVAMVILGLILKLRFPNKPRQFFHIWIAGLFMSAIPFSLFSYAQQFTTSSLAAIIGAATPMFTLLSILVIYRTEKIGVFSIIGLAIGLAGVGVTLGIWEGFGDNEPLAIFALVGAAMSYGIGGPYIRKFVTPMGLPGTTTAAVQVGSSAITLLPLYLLSGPLFIGPATLESVLAISALGILGSGLAYRLYHDVIAQAGSATASVVTYTNPVIATIWGIALLGEQLHWYEPIGAVVVILGAALAQGNLDPVLRRLRTKS